VTPFIEATCSKCDAIVERMDFMRGEAYIRGSACIKVSERQCRRSSRCDPGLAVGLKLDALDSTPISDP